MNVPDRVAEVVERRRSQGFPSQPAIAWPKDEWVDKFPTHLAFLRALPHSLDRTTVQQACVPADLGPLEAEAALLAVLAWGYGTNGYGRARAQRMLSSENAAERLLQTVRTLRSTGPLAAYQRLADPADCRIHGLGQSFGTKYLAFCSADTARPALILDEFVIDWLHRWTPLQLRKSWHTPTYRSYLDAMYDWASALQVEPSVLELSVFADAANQRTSKKTGRRGTSQWASRN